MLVGYVLCLSLRPLFALLIAFRECETFDFGTARRKGGNRSSRDCNEGIDQGTQPLKRESGKRLCVCRKARAMLTKKF